jgi:glycosyltransferase involved in cell wall biosynthesis
MDMDSPTSDATDSAAARSLRGRDILCFSHDWSGDPLSKTHLMRLLARDNRILWVNSIGYRTPVASRRDFSRAFKKLAAITSQPLREAERNIHVLNPLVIPAYGRPWVRGLNRRLLRHQVQRAMRRLRFRRPMNWVFNPAAAVIAGSLGEEQLIYYCVDEYAAFSGVDGAALAALEMGLLKEAGLVITSAAALYESKRRYNANTVLVRHGVNWDHFRRAIDDGVMPPPDVAAIPGPILGYFGLIANDWVDLDLLAHVARRLPAVSIVMIGKVTMDVSRLKQHSNIHLFGHRPYKSLPAYCKAFSAALIPFPLNEVTRNANPLKAREYLAAGLPVVSTALPEVEVLGGCRIGRDADDFVEQIRIALADPGPSAARSDLVRHESWEARLAGIASHVARTWPGQTLAEQSFSDHRAIHRRAA